MKAAPALVLASLVLVTALDARGASPDGGGAASVAAASQTLAAARATVVTAVQRIEADPPSTADLDAAHAAVGALKDAIDQGAEYEPSDLDYARAALAARKELRAQREYVDQRRAKVHIFERRRVIDAALTALKDSARRVEAKEPSTKDFEDARAAAKVLKSAVDEGRAFAKQDQKFESYLAETDATLARQEKAIDARWVLLTADTHRALVEEARLALVAAMATIGKGATDAQFEAADAAAALLAKRLEDGKVIEAGEKAYRGYAEKTRNEAAQAKKKRDELWSETGLARLKGEIEPARKDLVAAGRAVRARKPTAEQLSEAKTAAIVVRKLVEKFQPEAARSVAFGQYVSEVNVTLAEVEGQLQLRGLDSARTDLARALKSLEKRVPTDEHFAEATSAALVLEKTLETVNAKDPAVEPTAFDAKNQLRDARATVARRRIEVDVEQQTAKVEAARNAAAADVDQLVAPDIKSERIQETENLVNQVRLVLEAGAALISKDRGYAAYDREVKKRVAEFTGRIARRRLALTASDARAALTEALTQARSRLEAGRKPAATDADLEDATKSVQAIIQLIEGNAALEQQNAAYAAHAVRVWNEIPRLQEVLDVAKQARGLRKRTGEALAAGAAAADAAAASPDLRTQKAEYEKALAQFKACKEEGTSLVEGNPALAITVVLLDGRPSTPKDVIALCTQRAEATTQLIKPLVGLIAFEVGPKAAFEKATSLLGQGKKTEALAQFDECTATGMTLQYRSPELRDRQFQVGGATMTLTEVVKQCSSQGKSLRGK